MITLTNPVKVPASLGGLATLNYDKLVITSINADPVNGTITAQVRLTVSGDTAQPPILGTLSISTINNVFALLEIPTLGFYHSISIGGALSVIQGWITALQNNIEAGMVSTGAITGTQTTGV